MKFGIIRTRNDALRFTIAATLLCVVVAAVTTSAVFNLVQPDSHFAYVVSGCLIITIIIPIISIILSANVLSVEKVRMELLEQAQLDPLTGLMNRRAFREAVKREQRRMERLNYDAAILMVDIDFFKHVNDVHGHSAGDMVLQAVAKSLKENVRPSMDYVARWGGEEFIILLAGTDIQGAKIAAERLRRSVENLDPSIGKVRLGVTACFGCTELRTGQLLDEAIDLADRCLYQAKNGGRNRVVAAKPEKALRAVS